MVEQPKNLLTQVGTDEISIKSMTFDAGTNTTVFVLNHTVTGTDIINPGNANENAIKILAKPSDYVEAFFEDTAGLVEGVTDVFYSNKS